MSENPPMKEKTKTHLFSRPGYPVRLNQKAMSPILLKAFRAACAARKNSYSPYSHYPVGAAIVVGSRIFSGCNVENASYPAGICAERVALTQAVASGERGVDAVVVVTKGPDVGAPCGVCLQMLAEFCRPQTEVWLCSPRGPSQAWRFADLLGFPFTPASLK